MAGEQLFEIACPGRRVGVVDLPRVGRIGRVVAEDAREFPGNGRQDFGHRPGVLGRETDQVPAGTEVDRGRNRRRAGGDEGGRGAGLDPQTLALVEGSQVARAWVGGVP